MEKQCSKCCVKKWFTSEYMEIKLLCSIFFPKSLILAFMLYIYTFFIHFSPLYKHGKAKYFWQKFQRYVLRIAYLHDISTHNLIPTYTYMYVCKWMPVFYSRSQNKVRDQGTKTTNRYCKSLNLCSIEHVKREDMSLKTILTFNIY